MTNFIRQVRAHEGETVEIQWACLDGTRFWQRITIPPKSTRDAIIAADRAPAEEPPRNASGQVIDRVRETASGQRL